MRKVGLSEVKGLSAGLDEVGMGCWAGPVCVAVVAFPSGTEPIEGVGDSKKLSFKQRFDLAPVIMEHASFFGVGFAHPHIVDERGLSEAWRLACLRALNGAPKFTCLHIDGNKTIRGYQGRQLTYVKGDSLVWQIGAASIVAKVIRDIDMMDMGTHYPQYHWGSNMGYGTASHQKGLKVHGPTHYHRGKYLRNFYVKLASNGGAGRKWKSWERKWLDQELERRVQEATS